jgi:malonyl-CoA/methylmalonyl-CoA synthetase
MSYTPDISEWIESAAREQPQKPFLRTADGRHMSYASLFEQSGRFAAVLGSFGVVRGDRVLVQVDKSVEVVLLYLACLRLRAIFVPINVANTTREVDYFLRDSQPRAAVIRPSDRESLESLCVEAGVSRVETMGTDGDGTLPQAARTLDPVADHTPAGGADSPAAIVYTSGTTGRAKGAVLTRANLASNAAVLAEAWRFTEEDVLLHVLPLFHVHGLFVAINTVLASRSSLLLLNKFDPEPALRHMAAASVFMGVPTHYTRLLQLAALDREATSTMRLFVSGSAPLLAGTHQEFARRTGHDILERYGMTETLMNTSNPYDGVRRPGSVGKPLPGISVRVVDAATGSAEPNPDVTGGLEVKGPNVFAGYWRAPQKTRDEFTPDGWFKTGDLGCIDGEGYVHIVGRAKDLVITGGYNVYPKEVEMQLDAIDGIAESAVVGIPHPDFGEAVTAVVVARSGAHVAEADIILSLQATLARYKVPKRVLVVDELPRNTMGKVQKNVLRDAYATLYTAVE